MHQSTMLACWKASVGKVHITDAAGHQFDLSGFDRCVRINRGGFNGRNEIGFSYYTPISGSQESEDEKLKISCLLSKGRQSWRRS